MFNLKKVSLFYSTSISGLIKSEKLFPYDFFFHSLTGFLVLMKMENVAKAYNAKFVVNISEMGEDDPLTQNVRFFLFLFLLPLLIFSFWPQHTQ